MSHRRHPESSSPAGCHCTAQNHQSTCPSVPHRETLAQPAKLHSGLQYTTQGSESFMPYPIHMQAAQSGSKTASMPAFTCMRISPRIPCPSTMLCHWHVPMYGNCSIGFKHCSCCCHPWPSCCAAPPSSSVQIEHPTHETSQVEPQQALVHPGLH